ncbi:hypothetical protein MPER_06483 [Moniliophthora perniciosa FA553]|nr:hypothetical protein MPER_06483 [Moniliophthora perniciosa FA553]
MSSTIPEVVAPFISVEETIINPISTLSIMNTSLTGMTQGIAPTLIMVCAKLGKNVESLQDQVSDIRFTSRPAPREGTQTQIYSIENLDAGTRQQKMADGKEGSVV